MSLELPQYRAELEVSNLEGQARQHLDIYAKNGVLIKENNKYYGVGFLTFDKKLQIEDSINNTWIDYPVKEDTLSIKMPERNLFMSLDFKTGKGGDKVSDDEVLIWNSEMMNCTILSLYEDGSVNDYEIDVDNVLLDELEVIGIKE